MYTLITCEILSTVDVNFLKANVARLVSPSSGWWRVQDTPTSWLPGVRAKRQGNVASSPMQRVSSAPSLSSCSHCRPWQPAGYKNIYLFICQPLQTMTTCRIQEYLFIYLPATADHDNLQDTRIFIYLFASHCRPWQPAGYKNIYLFICQWHLNVHRNLSWWCSIHTVL